MEIIIGIGLDNIIFGMSQEEIKSILGEPDKINSEEIDYGIVYYFNKEMLVVKFDKDENFKLYSIESFNPEIKMFNKRIMKKSKDSIKTLLRKKGYTKVGYQEYDSFDTLYFEEIRTTLMFEFDRLRSIEFSPLLKNDDEIIWPSR